MITLDGSMGEGGGQVLRTALSLSLVTGQPFVLDRIRAGRQKPGLARQHLTCVLAAAEVGDAKVEGAELGSQRLAFQPRGLRAGDYAFAIGTAGSNRCSRAPRCTPLTPACRWARTCRDAWHRLPLHVAAVCPERFEERPVHRLRRLVTFQLAERRGVSRCQAARRGWRRSSL